MTGTRPSSDQMTALLRLWRGGDSRALEQLTPMVYARLRREAARCMRQEGAGHTLQPTALVNELFLEMLGDGRATFEDRHKFFAYAGALMRRILVRHARRRLAQKRGGGEDRLPLREEICLSGGQTLDLPRLLSLHQALKRLERMDPRQCRIVELRFFAGLHNGEIARALQLSDSTVRREWLAAKCWLLHAMKSARNARPLALAV